MIFDMIELLPTFFLAGAGLLGWGLIVVAIIRLAGRRGQTKSAFDGNQDVTTAFMHFGTCGLLGLTVAFVVGSAFHFFLPLKWVGLAFLLIGTTIFAAWACRIRFFQKLTLRAMAALGAFVLICLIFSARPVYFGDTALYHMQAVQWIAESPAVAGLGNLHGRFGFNSAWWVVSAMLEVPWSAGGDGVFVGTGVLTFFYGLLMLASFARIWRGAADGFVIIIACSCYLWFRQLVGVNNPSFATDSPANLFGVATAAFLVKACVSQRVDAGCIALIFATFAATTKLSAAMWLPGTMLVLICVFGSRCRGAAVMRPISSAVAFSALVGFLWIARGIWTSGYPFYPAKIFGFPELPWSVPYDDMVRDVAGIRNWPTRGGTATDDLWQSFNRWIANQFGLTNMIFAVLACFAAALACVFFVRAIRSEGAKRAFSALMPYIGPMFIAIGGLVFCFVAAPAMRFASGYFFALAGIGAAALWSISPKVFGRQAGGIAVALATTAILFNMKEVLNRPPSLIGLPKIPAPVLGQRPTAQGILIAVPDPDSVAWNAPRPSTPYFDPNIEFIPPNRDSVREMRKPKRQSGSGLPPVSQAPSPRE